MVIFLDIDGTLTPGKNQVSKKVVYAIQEARKNGHYIILCTGRNRIDLEPFMYIGFDGVISSAGGYIEIHEKEIHHCFNSQEDIDLSIKLFKKNHILYKLECDHQSFQDDEMLLMYNRFSDDLEQYKKDHCIYPTSTYNQERVQTIYFFGKKEDLVEPKEKLEQLFSFYVYGKIPNGYYEGEIMNKSVNKGSSIIQVMEYLNLPMSDSVGFGDSMNDYSMISTVELGIVMANGSDELKKYASSICESVYDDGIYYEFVRRGWINEV